MKHLVENKWYDNPMAVKILPDYYSALKKILAMESDDDIADFIEDYILANEELLARKIIGPYNDYIYCDHAAEMSSLLLQDAGIKHQVKVGVVYGESHAWVLLNEVIIDPTKSQFKGKRLDLDVYKSGEERSYDR